VDRGRRSRLQAALGLAVGYGAPIYLEAALQLLAGAPHVPLAAGLCLTVAKVAALPPQGGVANAVPAAHHRRPATSQIPH
jgi:hypothetical protein